MDAQETRYLKDLLSRRDLPVWRLPLACAADGSRLYTLDELVTLRPAIKLPTPDDTEGWRILVLTWFKAALEHERLHPPRAKYQLACPAGFVHGYAEAIDEVERRTDLGTTLLTHQREFIEALVADVFPTMRRAE
jgi:hypothetical protein